MEMEIISFQIKELYMSLVFIGTIIAYELMFYFFHQYRKIRQEEAGINKILVANGLIYGIGFIAIIIRNINRFFIASESQSEIAFKLTNTVVTLSVMAFLGVISDEDFKEIMNTTLTKLFCFGNFIPLVVSLFVKTGSPLHVFFMSVVLVSMGYILLFEVRLIAHSSKTTRNNLSFILLGNMILFGSFIVGGELFEEVFLGGQMYPALIFGSLITLTGLTITFLGLFGFRSIYELNWKDQLIELFVVDRENQKILYDHEFDQHRSSISDLSPKGIKSLAKLDLLFSKGLIGFDDILAATSKLPEEKIKKIEHEGLIILLNGGDEDFSFLSFGLIISKDWGSLAAFLRVIKKRFQEFYKVILPRLEFVRGHESEVFSSFDRILNKLLQRR